MQQQSQQMQTISMREASTKNTDLQHDAATDRQHEYTKESTQPR